MPLCLIFLPVYLLIPSFIKFLALIRPFLLQKCVLHKTCNVLHKTVFSVLVTCYVLVTVEISCVFVVSDRFIGI